MCGFLCVFRAFPVCALCSGVFSFLQSLPPPPFFRSNSFRCSIASSILSLCASSVQLYSSFLSRYLLLFLQPLPIPFISLLCTAPDACPIFSLCVFRVPIPLPLCRPFCPSFLRPWAFRSPYACFQSRCPAFPVLFPLFPAAFSSSFSFVPAFSFPFSPLLSSPSFSIKKKVPS